MCLCVCVRLRVWEVSLKPGIGCVALCRCHTQVVKDCERAEKLDQEAEDIEEALAQQLSAKSSQVSEARLACVRDCNANAAMTLLCHLVKRHRQRHWSLCDNEGHVVSGQNGNQGCSSQG